MQSRNNPNGQAKRAVTLGGREQAATCDPLMPAIQWMRLLALNNITLRSLTLVNG
ncbi:MAG: hypothetical protein ACTS5A_03105 [Candidatus Hodgkinia cicadicola]